ncbi:hypothetical protein, partial [Streptomyces sp. NPDC059538]|uniref:hypothetical protein n=1 Tax=Streptomyces sp. NPDC059538 TaxID=3346860 RepID=UPI0036BF1126
GGVGRGGGGAVWVGVSFGLLPQVWRVCSPWWGGVRPHAGLGAGDPAAAVRALVDQLEGAAPAAR